MQCQRCYYLGDIVTTANERMILRYILSKYGARIRTTGIIARSAKRLYDLLRRQAEGGLPGVHGGINRWRTVSLVTHFAVTTFEGD